ncbi:tail fiber domain-containing protein [Ensifer sp. T173]|uniref:Tail fiber domain-containing protein n=1 Tax=Ensifer canadensis TaxID=555315 RepID=A0AAW4FHM1_9HYPH|nr:tail fiber domain-containing protein [Ensifer canadensis]MBM3091613.1 tail fiber domain-containing protein [Ensifer canadensis]UBI74403.1 tail fiber domain-containing protein [Ensifer canadensis]
MGKSKTPKAPDPRETASAQTSTNIGTAIANGYLGNVNQVTPDGSLTYSQSGTNKWTDPMSGAVYDLPTWTATQTLSPGQQAIKTQNDAAELNLSKLANSQSGRLQDLLGKPFNLSGAPAAGDPSKVGLPQYAQYGSGPNLQTSLGNAGNVQSTIANAGNIQKGVADAGTIQKTLGDAGDITKTYAYSADTSRYENALMERMNPQLERSRAALETQLANQGLQPGSEAFNRAIDAATRQENDARFGAILNAGQEQSRLAGLARDQAGFQNSAQQQAYNQMLSSGQFANTAQQQQYGQNANNMQLGNAAQQQQFGQNQAQLQANNTAQQQKFDQGLASATFGNSANQQMYQNNQSQTAANNALKDQTFNAQQAQLAAQNQARAQYLNEQYALRNQPINEIVSLMSGAQVNNPNFVPTQGQSIPNIDYAGMVQQDYANKVGAYNQKQAGIGSVLGGLAGMFTLSDKTAKKDIEKVGELKGHGLYEYSYRGQHNDGKRHIGVMAQDVEKKRPDAVRKGSDGLRRVDYGALFAAGRKK